MWRMNEEIGKTSIQEGALNIYKVGPQRRRKDRGKWPRTTESHTREDTAIAPIVIN